MGPRAVVGRVIPNELIVRIKDLLSYYCEIPFMHMPTLYYFRYKEYLDASLLGFDNGLNGLLHELRDFVMISTKEGIRTCHLIEHCQPKLEVKEQTDDTLNPFLYVKKVHAGRREKDSFNPANLVLWSCEHRPLLDMDPGCVEIALSPIEIAEMRNPYAIKSERFELHKCLVKFSDGIPLIQLYKYYNLKKRLFNSNSYAALVEEFPEIFFVVAMRPEEEPRVYDGVTRTYSSLTGSKLKHSDLARSIVYQSIEFGLYQMTLILLRKAGKDGLKLSVWRQSIKNTYFDFGIERIENLLHEYEPLYFFMCLAAYDLVQVKSHPRCKNDLRVHFPKKPVDFNTLIKKLAAGNLKEAGSKNSVALS